MLDIPLEIKLAIVDDLKHASVYRNQDPFSGIAIAWPDALFRIREHRFSTITIHKTKKVRSLLDILDGAPSIGPMVQRLNVDPFPPKHNFYENPDLRRLFELLRGVTAVTLHSVHPFSAPGTASTFRCLPSSIIDVELSAIVPDFDYKFPGAMKKTLAILGAFPNMRHLALRCVFQKPGMEDIIEELEPFTALRSIRLPSNVLQTPDSVRQFIDWGLFPNVDSVTLEGGCWDDPAVAVLNELLRRWSSNLRELRMPSYICADPDTTTMFALPPSLEKIQFSLVIPFVHMYDDSDEVAYLDLWIRTLEQRCRSKDTLKSVAITVKLYPWPTLQTAGSARKALLRRLDALLGSDELHVMHLDWHLICMDGGRCDLVPLEANFHASRWVNEDIFPAISARFLKAAGRRRFGTTVTFKIGLSGIVLL